MSKSIKIRFKAWVVKFRCYVGIHNYQKGVDYKLAHRLDICKNPLCTRDSATYGMYRTRRWVEDVVGYETFTFRLKLAEQKRKVLIEKYVPILSLDKLLLLEVIKFHDQLEDGTLIPVMVDVEG